MRGALGATRGRIVRQLLTESLILSAAGAVLGLGLAFALVKWLAHQGSIALPLLGLLRFDSSAVGWTVILAVAEIFITATAEEWFARIGDKDCCVTPVRNAAHGAAPLAPVSIPKLSETPGCALAPAPRLGEHNGELL